MSTSSEPAPLSVDNFDAIIFDLGGVILNLDYQRTISGLGELFARDASHFYTQAAQNELFDRFERGEVEAEEFRSHVVSMFEREAEIDPVASQKAIDAAWNALILDIAEDTLLLLGRLAQSHRTFLLSNTNSIHLKYFLESYEESYQEKHGPFANFFEEAYYSHLMRQRKPEPRIFQTLIETHQLDPQRTLFLDDNLQNLSGAQSVGLRVKHHPTNFPLASHLKVSP